MNYFFLIKVLSFCCHRNVNGAGGEMQLIKSDNGARGEAVNGPQLRGGAKSRE